MRTQEETLAKYDTTLGAVFDELRCSIARYGEFHSTHEAYGVIMEEVEEMWECIKKDDYDGMEREAIQCAAMFLKLIMTDFTTRPWYGKEKE